uniref:MYB transcription factor 6 n=1 Tax=Carthamus tinctorius TaxID=4222 RepID=A0A678THY9_CARTI|nr:MYB transcription factor 6 [Carthamus tinctorius]
MRIKSVVAVVYPNCRSGPFIEDKENLDPTEEIAQEDGKSTPVKVKQPPALVEQNLDDQFFLVDKVATISATPKGPHARTPGKINSVILETTVDPLTITTSSYENPCQSLVSPHTVSAKKNKAASRFAVDFTVINDAFAENSGMLGETPLRKGLESPSAWKSPWFSSFLPGPRVDTDITIEDIGYFTSPGERSYDALGLMKQLSEHTASAYANAQEILGDETPDSLLKRRFSEKGKRVKIF